VEPEPEPVIVPVAPKIPPPPEPSGPSVADWVAAGEAALETKHWREPAEGSLAVALTNLAIAEPGNAAIGKLRQAAADQILPAAQVALEKRKWLTAADGFRDLVTVWPEHPEARSGLAEALYNQARVFKRSRDNAEVLTTADELLNAVPGDFRALLLRADALMALRRYAEARDAYAEARKVKPRNTDVNRGFWKAAQLARKQQG
jgi:tetratricopeptide (TPR) repeat protein